MDASELRSMAAAHQAHFIRRARERLNVKLTPRRYDYWCRKVREVLPGTHFVCNNEPHRSRWLIQAGTLRFHVIFDERTDRLVTCMLNTEIIPHKRYERRRRRKRCAELHDHAQAARRKRMGHASHQKDDESCC